MPAVEPKIEESWKSVMAEEFQKSYFSELKNFILEEKNKGKIIYPPGQQIFNAFNHTQFGVPQTGANSPLTGVILSARDSRQIQLALKFLF